MTDRKGHETGEKDQQLYSNLSIKCAGSAEHMQSVSFLIYFFAPLTSVAPRNLTKKTGGRVMHIFLIYLKGTND